jgi:hypothetical protein
MAVAAGRDSRTWPTILISGPPASGKSTLRRQLVARIPDVLSLGIDDILRDMHVAGTLDGGAGLREDGSLALSQWPLAVATATRHLFSRRAAHIGPAIVELPIARFWLDSSPKDAEATALIAAIRLHASLEVCLRRNHARGKERIPEKNLREVFAESSWADLRALVQFVPTVVNVSTNRNVTGWSQFCVAFADSWLKSSATPPTMGPLKNQA